MHLGEDGKTEDLDLILEERDYFSLLLLLLTSISSVGPSSFIGRISCLAFFVERVEYRAFFSGGL